VRPTQPPFQWPPGFLPGVKLPERDADPSLPSSAEAENEWRYTSTHLPLCLHDLCETALPLPFFNVLTKTLPPSHVALNCLWVFILLSRVITEKCLKFEQVINKAYAVLFIITNKHEIRLTTFGEFFNHIYHILSKSFGLCLFIYITGIHIRQIGNLKTISQMNMFRQETI
jgi:hypothetical protein